MFYGCSKLSGLPDGFSIPNAKNADSMFNGCSKLSTIGNNVKVANGAGATSTDNTNINKSLVTSIGDNFEWFTNATFNGTWDPALGIRNVFPNATNVGSRWKVYDYYDREDYFYIMPLTDGATVKCNNFKASYGLSSSLDKETWTALTGSVVATGVPAGVKVYLRGDTDTLGSTTGNKGCNFDSSKAFKAGGSALSLYSPTLEPKELMNEYDLKRFFYDTEICECSVDFGQVKSADHMFYSCSSLSSLPDGFSIPNMTDAIYMFAYCSRLSGLPDGFSIPNVTDADHMFSSCSKLSGLPDGFSAPNVTNARYMFFDCSSLSRLPDSFSIPNVTNAIYMFRNCTSLSSLPDDFNASNVTNTSYMFLRLLQPLRTA